MKKSIFRIIIILLTATPTFALKDDPAESNSLNYAGSNSTEFTFRNVSSPPNLDDAQLILLRRAWIEAKTEKEFSARELEITADYLNDTAAALENERSTNQAGADEATLNFEVAVSEAEKATGRPYTPRKLLDQVKIDPLKKTYTLSNGKTYDIHDRLIDSTLSAAKMSCEWDALTSRQLLSAPGCNKNGARICRGYVTCLKNGVKRKRLATCSERNCVDSTASECSEEPSYGSQSIKVKK